MSLWERPDSIVLSRMADPHKGLPAHRSMMLGCTSQRTVLDGTERQHSPFCAVLLNGQPVLEFYDVHQTTKWGALGYESLFFVFFFLAAWTVSILL